jgi:hypothetical protein
MQRKTCICPTGHFGKSGNIVGTLTGCKLFPGTVRSVVKLAGEPTQ